MTIDQLEEITGLDFFHKLPDDVENRIEGAYNPSTWGLKKGKKRKQ